MLLEVALRPATPGFRFLDGQRKMGMGPPRTKAGFTKEGRRATRRAAHESARTLCQRRWPWNQNQVRFHTRFDLLGARGDFGAFAIRTRRPHERPLRRHMERNRICGTHTPRMPPMIWRQISPDRVHLTLWFRRHAAANLWGLGCCKNVGGLAARVFYNFSCFVEFHLPSTGGL